MRYQFTLQCEVLNEASLRRVAYNDARKRRMEDPGYYLLTSTPIAECLRFLFDRVTVPQVSVQDSQCEPIDGTRPAAGLEPLPDSSAATIASLRAQVQDLAETIAVLLPDRAIDALIAKAAANPKLSGDFRAELKALLAKGKRKRVRRSAKR
jgi:hypothetical protein